MSGGIRRRDFIASALAAGGALAVGPAFLRDALAAPAQPGNGPYGPLGAPNQWGMRLPAGFTGRQIAKGGEPIGDYVWHFASDGQATYRTLDGGYILVSNSEAPNVLGGGASAIRFSASGEIERAYRILSSNMNCAGGPTPWGTWLSCEEHAMGLVWETDPAGVLPQQPRPALGNFAHEATATDPVNGHTFLTEDESSGLFYRFTPDDYPSLLSGRLEAAQWHADGTVTWHEVPDPNVVTSGSLTRNQVPAATRFSGGEGLWYDAGIVYFTTKGDKKVWAYDTTASPPTLEVIYDRSATPTAALNAVDNLTVSAFGDVYVCEDGGDMEIGIITPPDPLTGVRTVSPFVQMDPLMHNPQSEMVGVVFDPSGTRMYFGSQRAYPLHDVTVGTPLAVGAIYEVTGPFRLPPGGVPESKIYGPPAGEVGGLPLPAADAVPGLSIVAPGRVGRGRLRDRGLAVKLDLAEAGDVRVVLRTSEARKVKSERWVEPRPVVTKLASRRSRMSRGRHELKLPLRTAGLAELPRGREVDALVTVVAIGRDGRRSVASTPMKISAR